MNPQGTVVGRDRKSKVCDILYNAHPNACHSILYQSSYRRIYCISMGKIIRQHSSAVYVGMVVVVCIP